MANRRISCLLLLGATFIGICYGAPLITNEAEARKFVDKTNGDRNTYLNSLSQILNKLDDITDLDKAVQELQKIIKITHALAEIANNSKAYDYTHFKDNELQYIFKILRKSSDGSIVGDEKTLLLASSLRFLSNLSSDKDIEEYHDKSLKLAYYPDIQNIIAKSNNSDELIFYWRAWRTKNDAWTKENFGTIISILREAAKLTGELS